MLRSSVFLLVLVTLVLPGFAQAADRSEYFIGANVGKSWANMESGGINTAGGFNNTGDDDDISAPLAEIVVGKLFGPWRTELALSGRNTFEFTTNSFAPPTPTYFYDSEILNRTLMLSVYYDFALGEEQRWMPYVGAGMGGSYNKIDVGDSVVSGRESDNDFAWQVGAGVGYKMSDTVDVQLGYRYVDLGDADIDLDSITGKSGSFRTDLTAHEVFAGFRIKLGAPAAAN